MKSMLPFAGLACAATVVFLLAASPAPARLVGWWTFDEAAGASAADSSTAGANHPAGLEGGASFVADGKYGGAVRLDGIDGLVRVADHDDLEFDEDTSFTIAFWFRTGWDFPDTRGFLGKGYDVTPHVAGYYAVRAGSDDVPEFNSRQTGSVTPRVSFNGEMPGGALHDGAWHHVVVIKDVAAREVRIHIDNGPPATHALTAEAGDWAMGVNASDLIVGRYAGRWTQGDFDDLGIWNDQVLSTAQMTAIYQDGIVAGAPTDSDADGLDDDWELLHFGTLEEDEFGDFDGDGLQNGEEFSVGTDPGEADTDGDGLSDGAEFHSHESDPTDADSDDDGLTDGAEVGVHGTDPNAADSDGDGLTDGEEVSVYGSSPTAADSDGDGFADGAEVAAGSDPNDAGSKPAGGTLDTVVINEFMAANDEALLDEDGDASDWIELWNPSDSAEVTLTGWFLTDDASDPAKWRIPDTTLAANSFLVVFASGKDRALSGEELHTSFAIDKDGGYLALARPDGLGGAEIVHQFAAYGRQFDDVSFGLYGESAPLATGYFMNPTPGAANDAGAVEGFVADTRFTIDRGFYNAPQPVEIRSATPGASIIYTLDGSEPSESPPNGRRFDPPDAATPPAVTVTIRDTTQLRAMAVKDGYQPTNIDTQTYIFPARVLQQRVPREPFQNWGSQGPDWEMDPEVVGHPDPESRCVVDDLLEIPSISISLPFADMWGASGGIYADANQVTEKACSIEYLNPNGDPGNPNGEEGFQVEGTIQIVGGSSAIGWKANKLSMRVKFGPDLRFNPFDKPWIPFGAEATDRYDTLVLDARLNNVWSHPSSGQRVLGQYVRDQYIADLQNALGGTAPHGRHMHVYVAGLYWGMYTVHERPDDNFAAQYFGGDNNGYDCIKHNSSTVVSGTNSRYNQLQSLANNNLSSAAAFGAVEARLDLKDFARYMLVNYYGGNTDWSHHNWYATLNARDRAAKWHFHSWDAEHVLKSLTEDRTGDVDGNSPTDLHHALMANDEYRLIFADLVRKEFFNDGHLTPENAVAHYLRRIDDVNEAVRAESARWGDNKLSSGATPHTRGVEWLNELNRLTRTYFPRRTVTVLNQFRARGWYPGTEAPDFAPHGGNVPPGHALEMTSGSSGTIYYTLDGSDPREAFSGQPLGMAYNAPVTLNETAVVAARTRSASGEWSALTSALFVVGAVVADGSNLVVSEIHYRPASPSPDEIAAGFTDRGEFEFVELLNAGDERIDLTDLRFTAGLDFDFAAHSSIVDLAPGERLVIVENAAAFAMRYGAGLPVAGEFQNGTQLANGGEWLTVTSAALPIDDQTVQSFSYADTAPWPEGPDGGGYSLTLACAEANPDPADPGNWRSSVAIGGSPGSDDGVALEDWMTANGLSVGDELADDDGDFLPALLEYALGGSPQVHDSALDPVVETQILEAGDEIGRYAVLTFTRNNAADGVRVIPEVSADLLTWEPVADVVAREPSGQPGIDVVSVAAALPVSGQAQQFLRLRVEAKGAE